MCAWDSKVYVMKVSSNITDFPVMVWEMKQLQGKSNEEVLNKVCAIDPFLTSFGKDKFSFWGILWDENAQQTG